MQLKHTLPMASATDIDILEVVVIKISTVIKLIHFILSNYVMNAMIKVQQIK